MAPATTTEVSGTGTAQVTRSTATQYDRAGRPDISGVSVTGMPAATPTEPVPTQVFTYHPDTALPTRVTAGSAFIATGYDDWGRARTYTDADAATSTRSFDLDGRLATLDDGKGTYTYTYDGTDAAGKTERRGLLTSLDTGMGTAPDVFTAAYNPDGALLRQDYPNGLQEQRSYGERGELLTLSYTKGATTWLSWTRTDNTFGRTRQLTGPGSSFQAYSCNPLGRLAKTRDRAPSTDVCQTRYYGFDPNSNRTQYAQTTSTGPAACPVATVDLGPAENTFDTADRVTNPGYSYDPLGRTTTTPAAAVTGGTQLNARGHFAGSATPTLRCGRPTATATSATWCSRTVPNRCSPTFGQRDYNFSTSRELSTPAAVAATFSDARPTLVRLGP